MKPYDEVITVTPWYPNVIRVQRTIQPLPVSKPNFYLTADGIHPPCASKKVLSSNSARYQTTQLHVELDRDTKRISFADKNDVRVLAEKEIHYRKSDLDNYDTISVSFFSEPHENLYGFGNINGKMGIHGERIRIQHTNCGKRSPFFQSNKGYGILFNLTSNGCLHWDKDNTSYTFTADYAAEMDYFFILGTPREIVSTYRMLTGAAVLLPKKAFGYIHSRNRFENQKVVQDTAARFREKHIPLDTLIIDYKWWGSDKKPWNSFEWDTEDWPDPAKMFETLKKQHISTAISVWPDLGAGSEAYNNMEQNGFLLESSSHDGRRTYDASNPNARKLYWDNINRAVFSKGVDGIWLDADEPEIGAWTTDGCIAHLGNTKPYALIYPLLDSMLLYENQRKISNKRVNTLSRAAVAGSQRYGTQSWSGDIPPSWCQLKNEVTGVLNFHISGLPFFSTDTGGYFGINTGDPDKRELFLRWLQFSCFCSIFRVHGRDCDKAPWCFGSEYEKTITAYIRLRQQLIPYIYTLAIDTAVQNDSMVTPLFFEYPGDPNAWACDASFMLGTYMLIHPVTQKKLEKDKVYLPEGIWYDFFNEETTESRGEYFPVDTPIEKIPVFVRAGSIIPLGTKNEWVDAPAVNLNFIVYTGSDASFCLKEDDGVTYAYEKGEVVEIPASWEEEKRVFTLGPQRGAYKNMPGERIFKVTLITLHGAFESRQYTYMGEKISVSRFVPSAYNIPIPAIRRTPNKSIQVLPHSILGHWLFQEGEGGALSDSSGNYHTGNIMCCSWVKGYIGNALSFNGFNSVVDCGDDDSLNPTDELSVFIRLKIAGNGIIISKGGLNQTPGYAVSYTDHTLFFHLYTSESFVLSLQDIPCNEWLEIQITWNGKNGNTRLSAGFLSDTLQKMHCDKQFISRMPKTAENLAFGKSTVSSGGMFKGIIDEIEILNYCKE